MAINIHFVTILSKILLIFRNPIQSKLFLRLSVQQTNKGKQLNQQYFAII